jgi:hypothetical protein
MRVAFEEVPLDVKRRAVDHLESLRGTDLARNAEAARLGGSACPIYRPDLRTIAYWEVEVVGLGATAANRSGVGFIIASAGRHDTPIPHWSLSFAPPSRVLEAKAGAVKVARVVKVDALAYVAEDSAGNLVASLGSLPPRVLGIPTDVDVSQVICTFQASPAQPVKADAQLVERQIVKSGTSIRGLEITPWRSWADMRREYASTYGLHLKALAARASSSWSVEDLIASFGEGIPAGATLTVPLLKPGKVSLSGDGAKLIQLALLERDPPAVRLAALDSPDKVEAPFELRIDYADAVVETLKFFVLPTDTPVDPRNAPAALTVLRSSDPTAPLSFNPQPDPPILSLATTDL